MITANTPIEEWLAQEQPEAVLEPELPIIDPHHHLWDIRTATTEPLSQFEQKVYLCQEFADEIEAAGHNVVQTVFAECSAFYRADGPKELRCVGETEFVQGIAAMSRSGVYGTTRMCTGIFGGADMRLGTHIASVLAAHQAASPNFRGIRGYRQKLSDEVFAAFAELGKHNLSYDSYWPDVTWLRDLSKLAASQPDVTVVVNHLGGRCDANGSTEQFNTWRECLQHIAQYPNVVIKLGGAQQRSGDWEPAFHMHQRPTPPNSEELCELLYPFYATAMDIFGPDRCMFESNFPVDKESVSYRSLWNLFKRIAAKAGCSDADKEHLFARTAARAYQLEYP